MHIGNRSTRPEGGCCNTTNWKWGKHHKLYCPKRRRNNTHKYIFTLASLTLLREWSFSTGMEWSSKPAAQPALQLEVLTLMFKLLTFRPLLKFSLTPCASAQCPWLGLDRMPQISGAWVYLWSKVCQQSSSCCVKLLVKFTYQTISECGYERWHAQGSDTDMGVTDVWMCLVCVCVYDTQTIAECKQSAAHIDAWDSYWDMHCMCTRGMLVHVVLCYLCIAPEPLLAQVKCTGLKVFKGCVTMADTAVLAARHCKKKMRLCVCTCLYNTPSSICSNNLR